MDRFRFICITSVSSSFQEFKGEMRHGQDMVNNATQMGERVCLTTAPRGQEAIQKEIHTLKDDWSGFVSAVNEVEANLESTIGNWVELDDELSAFMQWMEKMEGKVKSLNESKADMSKKQRLAKDAEVKSFKSFLFVVTKHETK